MLAALTSANPAVLRSLTAALLLCLSLAACRLDLLGAPTATFTPSPTAIPPSATPIPSVTPTATPSATPTATPTPTATHTDSPTPTATATIFGIVRSQQRVNIRRGPGTTQAVIGSLAPDSAVQVIGQNDNADWYQVRLPDGGAGWISASLLFVENAIAASGQTDQAPDSIATFDLPIADLESMRLTATALIGAALTETSAAATPAPAETDTAPTNPTSGPPVTPRSDVNVFAFCDDPSYGIAAPRDLAAGSNIKIYWAWFASTEAYLRQHISNAIHQLRVNGETIPNVDQYRGNPSPSGNQYVVYWYVPQGPLQPGEYNINYRVSWRNAINDGYQAYGPGTATEFEEESCNFIVR